MTQLKTPDLLADIQFIDYWDANFFLKENNSDLLANIQFIDYWDTDFFSKESDSGASLDNSGASLDN